MDFQIYTVLLEDRLPRAVAPEDVAEVVDGDGEGVAERVDAASVEKRLDGCVALVFGRAASGESVCARVEGVRPRLFFELREGEAALDVKAELEAEVRSVLFKDDDGLAVRERSFCHFYGYEPDPSSPSGREVHSYAEVGYPSLLAWRAAVKLRKIRDLRLLQRKVADLRSEARARNEEAREVRSDPTRREERSASDAKAREADERASSAAERYEAAREGWEEWMANDGEEEGEKGREREGNATARVADRCRSAQEWFVDPVTRFLQEGDLYPGRWARVHPHSSVASSRVTTCDVEFDLRSSRELSPVHDAEGNAPYRVLYYDLETLGLEPHSAPVVQISVVVACPAWPSPRKHLIGVGSIAPLPDIEVHSCPDERELLLAFRRLVLRHDPDFVVAYNGVNFDNRFLAVRAEVCDVPDFWYLSRLALRPSRLRELRLSSSGMGDNVLRYLDMPGRATLDWWVKLKRDLTSEPSYKLDHFAKKFCNDEKEPMSYREIPVLQAGSPEDRARLASYCVHDSVLLHRLDEARTMVVEILQFAAVFGVMVEWIYFRGQQVRFVSQLLRKARVVEAVPLLLQRPPEGWSGEGTTRFQGATVNDPKCGFYKVPVATLDWKSLYPSIMMAHNLCHSTWVRDPARAQGADLVEHRISDDFVTHFCTPSQHKGVLPLILEELLAQRSRAKKDVKKHLTASKEKGTDDPDAAARHSALAKVFDGKQLALKVACNSIYGACGALETGKYPCLAISATVTHEGREAMVIKKTILPLQFPGIDVVYGDSVAEYTPLLLRRAADDSSSHVVFVATCDTLPVDEWRATPDGKEVGIPSGRVETWTEAGWTLVQAVYRHRVSKPLYRVTTLAGTVDVTEDHSLLDAKANPLPPRQCIPGVTELCHAWPEERDKREEREEREENEEDGITPERARSLGVAMGGGEGQCRDARGRACVPDLVLRGTGAVKHAFLSGLHGGDWKEDPVFEHASPPAALGLVSVLSSLGYRVLVSTTEGGSYLLRADTSSLSSSSAVVSVAQIPYSGTHVYDLTTANHHFHAGVGSLIVHNTDSVMVTFAGVTDVQTCGRLGSEAAAYVTDHFERVLSLPHMELEFEKCYHPYLQEGKKRYMGLKYEEGTDSDGNTVMVCKGIDAKGIETERRDTLPYVKDIMYDVRDALMYRIDEQEALRRFEARMDALVRDEVPIEKLTLRKNLSSKVEGKTDTIVQARVNALRRQREPGSEAAVNEQVEYVILKGHRKEKTTQLAEDPVYAKEHKLELNRLWYFEHCIEEALRKVFHAFEGAVDFKRVCDKYRSQLNAARLGVQTGSLRALMEAAAAKRQKREEEENGRGEGVKAERSNLAAYVPRPLAPPSSRMKTKKGL